jgi:hypothetical protein
MALPTYYDSSPMVAIHMLVGVYRHSDLMCKPGFYRVIPCSWGFYDLPHCHAVVDDFGDLVMVKQ